MSAGRPTSRSPATAATDAAASKVDLSRMRHELRTPINHILGYCEMLLEEGQIPEAHLDDLRRIHTGGRELQVLIARYFDEEQFFQQRDLHQLYHELRTPVNHIIGYSDLLIEQTDDPALQGAAADLRKIRDAAANWLALMEAYLVEPTLSSAAALDDASVQTPQAIALNLGFTFKVPEPKSARPAFHDEGAILVVDDDESSREMLARRLRRCGYTLSVVASGLHALALARSQKFDLVLLDMIMPGLDGFQVLAKFKADPVLRETPVIMLSALDEENGIARCIEMGAEDYLAKPFNPVFLRARIGACLEKKRLRDLDRLRLVELGRAHELVRRAFGRYVSEEVATSILQSPEGLELGGEEREVTILMSDLRGFTALAARLTPQQVIEFLNLYLEAMVEVISRYKGTIDEIIGDAILVIFGAPVASEDHAAKAVACGLAMQLAMPEVNQRLMAKGASELEMGIGIHTGRVIVGNIGSLRRTKYAAVGSNVNLAGRIESFTTGGQILISESAREKIKLPLRLDAQFQVEPKGAKERLQLHEVGGIGEPFNLSLPVKTSVLRALPQALPIRFTVLEEKFVGRTVHEGRLVAVSDAEAGMASQLALVPLSNLKIELLPVAGTNPGGEIYAKVIGAVANHPTQTRVRCTSVSPELKTWLRQMAGPALTTTS